MAKSRKSAGTTDKDVKDAAEPQDDAKTLMPEDSEDLKSASAAEPEKPEATSAEVQTPEVEDKAGGAAEASTETVETDSPRPDQPKASKEDVLTLSKDQMRTESSEETAGGHPDETKKEGDAPSEVDRNDRDEVKDDASDGEAASKAPRADAAEDKAPEPAQVAAAAPAVTQTRVVQGSMWPGVFGGVIAALIGFIVGRGDALDAYLPAALQRDSVDVSAIEAQTAGLAAQAEALAAQSDALAAQAEAQMARLDALEAAAPAAPAGPDPAVAEGLDALTAQVADLTARLAEVETRPEAPAIDAASTAAVDALQSELDAQKAEIAELAARAEEAEAMAASEAAQLLARAALTRVTTAVETGQAFSPALADLEEVTPVEVPEVLREAAEAGVPTLAALQSSFPDAARAGLAAARAEVPESEVDGLSGFLRRQLNVRSIEPKEGTDPDAVLSRAEAALEAGDLETALAEMDALPDAAKTAMADWLEAATARKTAQDAADALADSLNSN